MQISSQDYLLETFMTQQVQLEEIALAQILLRITCFRLLKEQVAPNSISQLRASASDHKP